MVSIKMLIKLTLLDKDEFIQWRRTLNYIIMTDYIFILAINRTVSSKRRRCTEIFQIQDKDTQDMKSNSDKYQVRKVDIEEIEKSNQITSTERGWELMKQKGDHITQAKSNWNCSRPYSQEWFRNVRIDQARIRILIEDHWYKWFLILHHSGKQLEASMRVLLSDSYSLIHERVRLRRQ
jgi:hypothetical protein